MTKRLKNKIVLITGASSGIGKATAELVAKEGAKLILVARRINRLKDLAEHLGATYNTSCYTAELDVRNRLDINAFFNTLPKAWQPIDVLINNAGLALTSDPLQRGILDNWDVMIDTNIKGLLMMSRHILPEMITANSGHIINIGSVAGQDCYPNGNVYSATKHAVRAISKSMRMDLLGTAIRVTEIAPAAVETEFSIVRWDDPKKADAFYSDFTPLNPDDVADAIVYCLTRPAHVNISEITLFPTDQAACQLINRRVKK